MMIKRGIFRSLVFCLVGCLTLAGPIVNTANAMVCEAQTPRTVGSCTSYLAFCAGDEEYPPGIYGCMDCRDGRLLCGYLGEVS